MRVWLTLCLKRFPFCVNLLRKMLVECSGLKSYCDGPKEIYGFLSVMITFNRLN